MITDRDEFFRRYSGKRVWCANNKEIKNIIKFSAPNKEAWDKLVNNIEHSYIITSIKGSSIYHTGEFMDKSYEEVKIKYPDALRYSDIIEDFEEKPIDIEETEREYKILKQMNTMEIKLSEILAHFKAGVERWKVDDQGKGSIEEIYGLTTSECMELFKNPLVKGRKVTKIKEQQTA